MILKLLTLLIITSSAWATCDSREVKFQSENFDVQVLSFSPLNPQSLVLIIPPTGGANFIDRRYAAILCSQGIGAYILAHWTNDSEFNIELSIHTRFYARAFKAIGLVLNQLPPQLKVGILGTSVGGFHAAIAASRYSQITSAFIITGGAHIPSIIANSDQKAMKDAWTKRRKIYQFKNKGEYIAALEKVIELEPLNRLEIKSPKKFGLVIGTLDHTVPTLNQERLKTLWTPQKVIYQKHDHFWAIVLTWLFDSDEIVEFFKS